MRHEKIIKRKGTKYLIVVDFYFNRITGGPVWNVQCWIKHKKEWNKLPDTISDRAYQRLNYADKERHDYTNILRFVTAEEILNVKLELWEKLKPI